MNLLGLPPKNFALACVGAIAGGALGAAVFWFLLRHGFYAVAFPGALVGIGAGMFAKRRSIPFAVACGVAALLVGLLAEWRIHQFIADDSLGYFFAHLHELSFVTWIMLGIGVFVAVRASLAREAGGPPTS